MIRSWLRAFALLGLLAAIPLPALAHAVLMTSRPAAGDAVKPGKTEIQLRYNSRIDAARSRVTLIRPGAEPIVLAITAGATPDTVIATAELAPGAYLLRWQVLAIDGHITRGELPFTVAAGSP